MKESFEIADLIVAFIRGEIVREDLEVLDEWLDKSEKNRTLFVSFMDEKIFREEKQWMSAVDLEKTFACVKAGRELYGRRQLRIRRWRNRLAKIAAVLVIVLGIMWLWKYPVDEAIRPEAEQHLIQVGKQKAFLVLASGERFELSGQGQDTIRTGDGGQQIILNGGQARIEEQKEEKGKREEYNTMEVPRGAEYKLILPDGSQVWLNAGSCLKFPTTFGSRRRYVELSGEAYFAVKHEENRPFMVSTGEVDVTVLGTEFCMSLYKGKPVLTTLVKGKVEVSDRKGWKAVLRPGQQAVTQGGKSIVREVETIYYTAWKEGYFIFEDTPLEEIMEQLSLWYNCNVFFENEEAAGIRMTARLKKYDKIGVLLDILAKTREVVFEEKVGTIIVRKR